MPLNPIENSLDLNALPSEATFSSVWGNAMQREDFLALAAGLRQFNAGQADVRFSPSDDHYPLEPHACA